MLTHPEAWADQRLDALWGAWLRTGCKGDVRLVSEPVAAATWFAQGHTDPGSVVGVLDYGGGTCDAAVLRASGDPAAPFEVLAYGGDPRVGGNAIDRLFIEWVKVRLEELGHGELVAALDEPEHLGELRTFHEQLRGAKEALSEWEDASIPVSVGKSSVALLVTVSELDAVVAGEVAKARRLMERTLSDAGVEAGELEALYLTGGSSHVRLVHAQMAELLAGRPAILGDPKLVVSLGAALAWDAGPRPRLADPERNERLFRELMSEITALAKRPSIPKEAQSWWMCAPAELADLDGQSTLVRWFTKRRTMFESVRFSEPMCLLQSPVGLVHLLSPYPGATIRYAVEPGDPVLAGQPLVEILTSPDNGISVDELPGRRCTRGPRRRRPGAPWPGPQ